MISDSTKATIFGIAAPIVAVATSLSVEARELTMFWLHALGVLAGIGCGCLGAYWSKKFKDRQDRREQEEHDAKLKREQEEHEAKQRALMTSAVHSVADPSKTTVLVVEDNETTSEQLRRWLEKRNFEVYHAPDALSAIAIISTTVPFDAVLVDMTLGSDPEGGLKVLAKLNERPGVRKVVVTGHDDPGTVAAVAACDATLFVKGKAKIERIVDALRGSESLALRSDHNFEDIR